MKLGNKISRIFDRAKNKPPRQIGAKGDSISKGIPRYSNITVNKTMHPLPLGEPFDLGFVRLL